MTSVTCTLPAPGHFPYLDEPERSAATLEDWIATTQPGAGDETRFRDAIRRNGAPTR